MKEKKTHSFAIPIEMKQKSTCIGGDVYHFNWDCFLYIHPRNSNVVTTASRCY